MNMGLMHFSELEFCPDICPGRGLLDHMVALFLVFQGIFIMFSMVAVPSTSPPTVQEGFLFSALSPTFIICHHSDQYEVIPCCYIFFFPQNVSYKCLILQMLCEKQKILYSNWCGKGYELTLEIFMTLSGKLDTSCCKETCLTLFITPPRTFQNLFDHGISFYVKIKNLTLILLSLSRADLLRSLMLGNDKWPQFVIPPRSCAFCHVTLGCTSTLTVNLAV